jgi:hypothetical protein
MVYAGGTCTYWHSLDVAVAWSLHNLALDSNVERKTGMAIMLLGIGPINAELDIEIHKVHEVRRGKYPKPHRHYRDYCLR